MDFYALIANASVITAILCIALLSGYGVAWLIEWLEDGDEWDGTID